jgi:hypothetical protein
VALREWSECRPQLERYLKKGVHAELQMGVVSGLSDIPEEGVAELLIESFGWLSEHNRKLSVEALVRTEDRCLHLLTAIDQSKLPAELRTDTRVIDLQKHESTKVRELAGKVLR